MKEKYFLSQVHIGLILKKDSMCQGKRISWYYNRRRALAVHDEFPYLCDVFIGSEMFYF